MGLKSVFESGVDTAFSVFKEAVYNCQYIQIADDGFSRNETPIPVSAIIVELTQDDIAKLSFSDEIQPTDVQCLVKGKYLFSAPDTRDEFLVISDYFGNVINEKYSIVGFSVDPMKVLYTIVLRNA